MALFFRQYCLGLREGLMPQLVSDMAGPSAEKIQLHPDKYTHIVGSRPGRKGSFRIEAEKVNGRTVVHNYGHGGYGVTLSPGSAIQAIRLVENVITPDSQLIIIGAGVNGLTIAYMLASKGLDVEIVSKDIYPNIVSGVAAALWNPYSISDSNEERSQMLFTIQDDSLNWFINLLDDSSWGVRPVELFVPTNRAEVSEVPFFLPFKQTPIKWHKNLPIENVNVGGYQASTYFIDTSIYMPKMMTELANLGVKIKREEVESIAGFIEDLDDDTIVFNASGLGAKWLVPDSDVEPIRGDLCVFDNHLITPALKNDYVLMWGERPDYMFTRVSNEYHAGQYIFGGVYEYGDGSTDIKQRYCDRTIESYHSFIESASKK